LLACTKFERPAETTSSRACDPAPDRSHAAQALRRRKCQKTPAFVTCQLNGITACLRRIWPEPFLRVQPDKEEVDPNWVRRGY